MIIECETIRRIHKNENFQLIACMPIGEYQNLAIHPRYHTITIKDPTNRLVPNKTYTLEVSELPNVQYGMQYLLEDIPSLSFSNTSDIDDKMEFELLQEIMSEHQAKYVHKAYPNFIRLILSNKTDEINVNNIYNVSDKRLAQYIRKIDGRYNTFILRSKIKQYDLKSTECAILLDCFEDIDSIVREVEEHPYYCLITLCHRSFRQVDINILSYNSKWKYEQERIEYMMDYAISTFETEGSTYVDAIRLAQYVRTIDNDVVPMLKDIAIKSDIIIYDEKLNILQRASTYNAELNIATFLKNKINNNSKLDWDWESYTQIKDGELTVEQQNVLKTFCESNVVMLDAPSGTGKTSSLMALIQMIEHYNLTYIMMSPTGKAASRLSEQTGRPASTIHRAVLGNQLYDKDVLIIDESSMLSIDLVNMIIGSELSNSCRLLFVGDSAQIPSIGLGRVFKDMGESNIIPKCTLTKCFRFEEGGASYISTLTREGDFYFTEEQLNKDSFTLGEKQDYEFIKFDYEVGQIVDAYMKLIIQGISPQDIMVLVPYNIGKFGAININNLIQNRLNPIGSDRCLKTKHNDTQISIHAHDLVMNIKNNYHALKCDNYLDIGWEDDGLLDNTQETAVFNGQTGVVKAIQYDVELGGDYLVVDIDGENIIYTQSDVNNLLLAYASNPYKFQGSQCKYIINVVIPAHERSWNRQLLYTSQTRMTTKLIEIGEPNIIKEAIKQIGDDNRKTRLKEFLCLT